MTVRKADEFEKRRGNVCCIKDCENEASNRGSNCYLQTFFRFGKFWEFERHICEEHKHLMHSDEVWNLIDRKKRRWVKPYSCGCGRQATEELRGLLRSSGETFIESYQVCERHYKEMFNEEADKKVQEFIDGCEEEARKAKKSKDVVRTEDGSIYKVEFDKKKIH